MNYHGEFVNIETNADNENIQKLIQIDIEDTEATEPNPYNINWQSLTGNTPGTYLIRVFFNNLTVDIINTTLQTSIDNGATWVTIATGLISPHEVEIIEALYVYRLIMNHTDPADDETFRLDQLDGQTEDLEMAGDPLKISVIDNAEDKFTPIRAKQAEIQIYSSNSIDISTFATGGDNRWKVTIYSNYVPVFIGFLSISDLSQEFLPDPNLITLIATDGLGFLNDIPLTDFDGNTPQNENEILEYILWALNKTGLELNLAATFNIKNGHGVFSNQDGITFSGAGQYFVTDSIKTNFFYVGQVITFSGTASNNFTDTVTEVDQSGVITLVRVSSVVITGEYAPAAVATDNSATVHFFKDCFLDAKTFEAEIGECENCYQVLSKILGREACLFQNQGEWRVIRIDEMDFGIDYTTYRWIYTGELSYIETEVKEQEVGIASDHSWMNDDAIIGLIRPVKELRLTYNYETPAEVPCNNDFSRGDLIDGSNTLLKTYEVECWDRLWSNTSTDDPQTTGIYIRKVFSDADYEEERYVVLEFISGRFTFIMSAEIPVTIKDKFNLNIDRRLSGDIGSSGHYIDNHIQVRLYGDDGTFWTHSSGTSINPDTKGWYECNSTFRTNQKYFSIEGDLSDDFTESKSLYDSEASEIPVSGYIKILIYRTSIVTNSRDTYITFSFEYIPFINGSYKKYTGQQQIVTNGETRDIQEEQVYISDSPKKLFKGALLKLSASNEIFSGSVDFVSGSSFSIIGDYSGVFKVGQTIIISSTTDNNITAKVTSVTYAFVANATAVGLDEATVTETSATTIINAGAYVTTNRFHGRTVYGPYGEIQVLDNWNQMNRVMVYLNGTVDKTDPIPDLIHKFTMTDINSLTTGRIFILLHYEIDKHLCEWTAYFVEVANSAEAKQTTGNTFKYITE